MDRRFQIERAIPTDPSVRSSESLFLAETSGQGGTPTRKLLGVEIVAPPPRLTEVAGSEQLIVRRRLMSVDAVPVRISNSYFLASAPEAETLASGEFIAGGLQALFENNGRSFGHTRETLIARPPTKEEAELLEIDAGTPVVQILRCSFDIDGLLVHALESICAADKHTFVVNQLPGDQAF